MPGAVGEDAAAGTRRSERGHTVIRREILINWGRLALLRWRVLRGRALPGVAMMFLKFLDALAERLAQRKPR